MTGTMGHVVTSRARRQRPVAKRRGPYRTGRLLMRAETQTSEGHLFSMSDVNKHNLLYFESSSMRRAVRLHGGVATH